MQKRHSPEDESDEDINEAKKTRFENSLVERKSTDLIVTSHSQETRTSHLAAPTMLLTGHEGAIYSLCFDPSGQHLVSSSFDRQILLWDVYGECKNYNVLSGHKNAVIEVKWASDGVTIVSCSADKTVCLWDANKGTRTRKLTDHVGIVNCCATAAKVHTLFASGSDDSSVILWDSRSKAPVNTYTHDYQITSVCLSSDGQHLFSGGIDNIIRRWDIRKADVLSSASMYLKGHTDTITGLSLSPDGNFLLSNSMDSTLRNWDIRPFVPSEDNRCVNSYSGVHHGAERLLLRCGWSADQTMVTSGSADRIVRVFDANTAKVLYHLPGHKGSVNEVVFHPTEPIIASCGSDKNIYLGELSE